MMMTVRPLIKWLGLGAALLGVATSARAQTAQSGFANVDPFIGTGPDGHTFPGAVVPFGMVQPSPDTLITDFKKSYTHAAGYRFGDPSIQGFSQTHFSGTGHSDLGDMLLMPIAGEVKLEPGDPDKPGSGYRSRFSHASETAEPGYYAVDLADYGVKAELTATTRVALHRYTFPAGKPAHVLMDLRQSIYNYPGKVLWSKITVHPDGTITGERETRGWAPGRRLYFAMTFSAPVRSRQLYDKEPAEAPYKGFKGPGAEAGDTDAIEGRGLVGVFDFGPLPRPLPVKIAISSVSETGAFENLMIEAPEFLSFDQARASARAKWEEALGSIEFDAPTAMRKTLYTSLYHALQAPSVSEDVDGSFRGPDNEAHVAKGFTFVSTFSLWDTYRAEQPLMTLIQPSQRTADVVNSLIVSREESPYGLLPVWQFQGIETWCMIGYHAVPEIADAIVKGIPGFDTKRAMAAMTASATYAPYGHLGAYMKLGYVPTDLDGEGVSKTVEYAFDDWTIAKAAEALEDKATARTFFKRAENWKNVFDGRVGFVRPKLSTGQWREPFDPAMAGADSGFTEGNA